MRFRCRLPFGRGKSVDIETEYDYLRRAIRHIDVVHVRGIATSEHNSRIVEEAIRKHKDAANVIVVAYSKGVPDTLEALRRMGNDTPRNLRALVSVAGWSAAARWPTGSIATRRFWKYCQRRARVPMSTRIS